MPVPSVMWAGENYGWIEWTSIVDSKIASAGGGGTDSIARASASTALAAANSAASAAVIADSKAVSAGLQAATADSKATSAGAMYDPTISTSAPSGTPPEKRLWVQY